MKSVSRSSFLKTAGAAAAISVTPGVAAAAVEPETIEIAPTEPLPRDPIIAIVRDVARGEVTVLQGTSERTYRDRPLARRLLRVAQRSGPTAGQKGVA
jgi:hypothetical protein